MSGWYKYPPPLVYPPAPRRDLGPAIPTHPRRDMGPGIPLDRMTDTSGNTTSPKLGGRAVIKATAHCNRVLVLTKLVISGTK